MKTCREKTGPKQKPWSVHLIADLEAPKFIEDARKIKKILWDAARAANNTPLKTSVHKFPVQGVTGVIILAESHIAIHTWPEYDYIAVDIFTCGKKTRPYNALKYLKKVFAPRRVKARLINRGTA
jgi:S-adenosylmethionine decarboxylase